MSMTLNIGLRVDPLGVRIRSTLALAMLRKLATVESYSVRQSATEATLVVKVSDIKIKDLLTLSDALWQDSIAFWDDVAQYGRCVGPRSSKWNPFNPAFFLHN